MTFFDELIRARLEADDQRDAVDQGWSTGQVAQSAVAVCLELRALALALQWLFPR